MKLVFRIDQLEAAIAEARYRYECAHTQKITNPVQEVEIEVPDTVLGKEKVFVSLEPFAYTKTL